MRRIHESTVKLAGCFSATFCFVAAARADVYALTTPVRDFRIVQFSGDGRFVTTYGISGESIEGIDAGSDGWIYYNSNNLGGGTLWRFRPERPNERQSLTASDPLPGSNTSFNIPLGLTVASDGNVYATSNKFVPPGISGVFRYDPANGNFRPVVRLPDAEYTRWVAVGPDGDIYLSNGTVRRFAAGTGEFVGVSAPVGGDVEFGPDGNLYVARPQGIDRYDPDAGALINHFIADPSGGLNGVRDFVFGGDGLVYVNTSDRILRYDAVTGAFRDVFVTPEQYTLAGPGGVIEITYVAPEPGTLAALGCAVAVPLLRRRR